MAHLKRSCPAVSQICSLMYLPLTSNTLEPNSTPIVWEESRLTANEESERVVKVPGVGQANSYRRKQNKKRKKSTNTFVIEEAMENARLAHACITNDNELEQQVVRVGRQHTRHPSQSLN